MSIKNIRERLEGSYKLIRIKRIKLGFFSIEMALGLVLGFTMAFMFGAKFEPFYIPLDMFLFIILIMLLVITIEAIYFKGLEIRYTRNKSRKFLMARNAIRRSMIIIAVSGLCILFLMLPQSHDRISDTYAPSSDGPITVPAGETIRDEYFMTQDSMGLTRVNYIRIEVDNYTNDVDLNLNTVPGVVAIWQPNPDTIYEFSRLAEHSDMQNSIYIVVENTAATGNISFTYSVTSEVSPFLKLYIPALALAFIVVQFAAISIMYPIRETYASSSIYSKKYVAKTDAGEYSVKQIKKTHKETEEIMLDEVLDMELPPEPATPKPQPQARIIEPEMARARGKVDDDLVEEADVKCSGCGEMNSAHAAMCFSCGNPMAAMEAVAINPIEYLRKGETFAKAGKYEDAITCYDETLKHDAVNEIALLRKGEALHKLGKWGSAVQYVNTALKINPNNIDTLILKAKILDDRDRLDKSMEIYSQILALDPENAFAKSKMEKVSQKFVEAAEEAELETAEDILEEFMCVPGIGLARATALYDAGFTSMAMLKKASEEQLVGVKGISKGIAKKIRKGLDGL
ncbi:MAG: tetratricopeptide repeat protein [Candidatus Thermoplasmatota archaeon]|nr:tetratricopeptide repeat protein [Candidatus Thermoplasmatota archaeon]MBU4071978.1 tetratricopeptide repeat protein [Candidatus Thermoplasmatota archaeon]MBU4145246.1 tetratricopeptide repeat protein [Candidatus Thermoplasmatota archaeon]MBU4591213.1 tetratricopeptide repeat protein [Candidatus Thermoplasmatota archaeon]